MTGYLVTAFIYLCAAVIAVPVAKRLGLGSVLGYLIAGVVIALVVFPVWVPALLLRPIVMSQPGWLMAVELRACGIDFSFAPVLDLAHGLSGVIGDRAFHGKPHTVATLAYAFMHGMNRAGMQAVGKHFPGHGGVVEDSHVAMPVDHRDLDELLESDIVPFQYMIENKLAAIMPAHVIYDHVDEKPAGYSEYWVQSILRQRLHFNGVIFSDDLSMEAACVAGGFGERAEAALQAGCDMALVCNHLEGAIKAAEYIKGYSNPASALRLVRMHGTKPISWAKLKQDREWQLLCAEISALNDSPELEMDV